MPPLMALAVLKGNKTDAMGSVMALMTMAHSLGMLLGALLAGLAMDIFHRQSNSCMFRMLKKNEQGRGVKKNTKMVSDSKQIFCTSRFC